MSLKPTFGSAAAVWISWVLGVAALAGIASAAASGSKAAGKDVGGGWREKTNDEGKVVQELKIEAPSMTEEDQYGYNMPDRYRCDACRAVMYHVNDALKKAHPKSRRMKQWEYTDTFDDACKSSFQGYGISLINGENTLSGPGLKRNQDQLAPGSGAIQMGGETWGKRLTEVCKKLIYQEMGEEELYEKYQEDGEISENLCYKELRQCVKGPKPPPKSKQEDKDAKAEKAKTKAKKEKAKKQADSKTASKAQPKSEGSAADPSPPQTSSPATSAGTAGVAGSTSDERINVQTFLRGLAERHGLTSDEYLTARTRSEWEKLTVAMAGRIFNRLADSEPSESCRATSLR